MFCPQCGTSNADNTIYCSRCGRDLRATIPAGPGVVIPPGAQPAIPNYLVPAILVTVLCCLPAGIVAIVYAAQVNSKLAGGDIAGAQLASKNAKMWCWISGAAALVLGLCYAVVMMLTFMG